MSKDNLQVLSINNIKNSYLIGFALVNFIIFGFYLFMYKVVGVTGHIPTYMKVYLIISLILWLLLYLQEKGKIFANFNKYNYKSRIIIYFIINILAGYNVPYLMSSAYVFFYSGSEDSVFEYWLLIGVIILISLLGLFLFCYSEFEMFGNQQNTLIKLIGILIVIASLIGLIYVSIIAPADFEEGRVIWVGCIFLMCIHVLVGRSFFYLAVLINDIKEEGLKL
ncbi:DUF5079 family protein [Staphylococcus pasteuri]|uniref:DUF5079 family protein n=1 Tax=Staphylococcus pasteuri TaxID=45972 RepID=UPI001E4BAAC0|nr:DUF5079 family protein [Staphylococcus pasteuri]MCE3022113.1 DUF5079 family protein [Staphylococcus pasteuri]